jgi:AcrR family transcriptional regulator
MTASSRSPRRHVTSPPSSPASASTRDLLVELAAQVFADEGYASASVRDLGRRAGLTSGALYGNFRGKAELLTEAVDARLTTDLWTLPDDITSKTLTEIVVYQFQHYDTRTQLMSLLLESVIAARTDDEIRERLRQTIARRIDRSTEVFRERREAEKLSPDVDLDAAMKVIWSVEIGLRVLSLLGIEGPEPEACADVVRRLMIGLQAAVPAPKAGSAGAATTRTVKGAPGRRTSKAPAQEARKATREPAKKAVGAKSRKVKRSA